MKERLSRWEYSAVAALLLIALIYSVFVECRATLTKNHNTDFGVYLAAAEAVREHHDIYTARYNHDHYMYPPLLAIMLARVVPAPPLPGQPASTAFAIMVNVWYDLSLLVLAAAIYVLAKTLSRSLRENTSPHPPQWHPIWTLSLVPILLCIHALGRELQLGQVNLFLMALMVMAIASAAEGRSYRAGLWLAAAICLKVMPVLLIVYPLWRRDWRWLLSCLGGMVVCLLLLPMLILGYDETIKYSGEYANIMILPAVEGKITDHSRDGEMLNQNAVHNYSILGVIHNLENISTPRDERPKKASVFNRHLAAVIGLGLCFLTLAATGIRRQVSPLATVLCLTMLTAVMLITSPVCQSYYFVLLMPLFMAVVAVHLRQSAVAFPRPWLIAVCVTYPVAQGLSSFSPLIRDSGLVLATVLLLWFVAFKALRREIRGTAVKPAHPS